MSPTPVKRSLIKAVVMIETVVSASAVTQTVSASKLVAATMVDVKPMPTALSRVKFAIMAAVNQPLMVLALRMRIAPREPVACCKPKMAIASAEPFANKTLSAPTMSPASKRLFAYLTSAKRPTRRAMHTVRATVCV